MRARVRPAVLAAVCGAALGHASCARPAATGLVLEIGSDMSVPDEIDRFGIRVTTEGKQVFDKAYNLGSGVDPVTLPARLGLVASGDGAPVVGIELQASKGTIPVVTRTARLHFLHGEVRLLRMDLERACGGMICGPDKTCIRGACADDAHDVASLPKFEPGSMPAPNPDGAPAGDAPGDEPPTDAPQVDAAGDGPTADLPPGDGPCLRTCTNEPTRLCATDSECGRCSNDASKACSIASDCDGATSKLLCDANAANAGMPCGSDADCKVKSVGTCSTGGACTTQTDCSQSCGGPAACVIGVCTHDRKRACTSAMECAFSFCSNAGGTPSPWRAECKSDGQCASVPAYSFCKLFVASPCVGYPGGNTCSGSTCSDPFTNTCMAPAPKCGGTGPTCLPPAAGTCAPTGMCVASP